MNRILEIPIHHVIPDQDQPRKDLDEEKINELAKSIKQHGLLQPILVKLLKNGKFQLVCGERRWRACRIAGAETILAEVRELSDEQVRELQLVENLQRENLNPLEEAETFQRMIDQLGYNHREIAQRINKSREYVTNKLRLLRFPDDIKAALRKGEISESHTRILVSQKADSHEQLLNETITKGFTVRDLENFVKGNNSNNVSRETSSINNSEENRTYLVEVNSEANSLLTNMTRKTRLKLSDLIIKAVLAFAEKEEVIK